MNSIVEFSKQADEVLKSYYNYEIFMNEVYSRLNILAIQHFDHHSDLKDVVCYIQNQAEINFENKYADFTNPVNNLAEKGSEEKITKGVFQSFTILTTINFVHSKHDLIMLNSYSALKDISSMFVLPYKINHQKYSFQKELKDALSFSLYNYQLQLEDTSKTDPKVRQIITEIATIEKELKENINKLPKNYEKLSGKIKQLLIKLKEFYSDNIFGNQLQSVMTNIYTAFITKETVNFEELHHKLRSVTNS